MQLDVIIGAKKRPGSPMPLPKAFGEDPAKEDPMAGSSMMNKPNEDDEDAEKHGEITVSPEAVSYRGPEKKCSFCEYYDNGHCKVLKMSVEQDAGCNAWEKQEDDNGIPLDESYV